ncbi:hypothetical protein [Mycobacteroides franklinii]|uniref:hypothetical protein n=1 Tax=Mycobacteroides franklinii TaxID=948102 RepID=UPI0009930E29|nr:hypothetical protein [Mycobacteroides franklinii]
MSDMSPATDKQRDYIAKLAKGRTVVSSIASITRGEASAIIDDLLKMQGVEKVHEYVAVEYRKWVDNKYASNGRTPSTTKYFTHGDAYSSDIREVLRKAGSLAEVLYRGRDEELARRVMQSHQGGYELAGAHGHERLLKHLAPQEDIDLLSDVTPAHLREAVRRKTTRTGWVFEALSWWTKDRMFGPARQTVLRGVTRTDTLAVIGVLGDSMTAEMTGTEAQQLVDRAVETHQLVEELLGKGHPSPWASKMARNKTGVEMPELVAAEMVRRKNIENVQVSA